MANVNDGVLRAGQVLMGSNDEALVRALFVLSERYFSHNEIYELCERASHGQIVQIVLATIAQNPVDGPWIQFWGSLFREGEGFKPNDPLLGGVVVGLFRGAIWLDEQWGVAKNPSYQDSFEAISNILTFPKKFFSDFDFDLRELGELVKVWVRPKKEWQQGIRATAALGILENTWEKTRHKPDFEFSPVADEIIKQIAFGVLGKINSSMGILLAFASYNKALKEMMSDLVRKR